MLHDEYCMVNKATIVFMFVQLATCKCYYVTIWDFKPQRINMEVIANPVTFIQGHIT